MYSLRIWALSLVLLGALPWDASAGTDPRSVADMVSGNVQRQHKLVQDNLVQASKNPVFTTFFATTDAIAKQAVKAKVNQVMLELSRKYNALEMCLIGAGGPELARVNAGHIADDLDPNEMDNEFFGPAMAAAPGVVYVVAPYISHDAKKWVSAYATPIALSGHTKGVLHYEFDFADYQKLVRKDVPGDMHVMLVHPAGYIVADNRADISVVQKGDEEKHAAYFKKFMLRGHDMDALKNKLRGGSGKLEGAGGASVAAWRDVSGGTVVVVQD